MTLAAFSFPLPVLYPARVHKSTDFLVLEHHVEQRGEPGAEKGIFMTSMGIPQADTRRRTIFRNGLLCERLSWSGRAKFFAPCFALRTGQTCPQNTPEFYVRVKHTHTRCAKYFHRHHIQKKLDPDAWPTHSNVLELEHAERAASDPLPRQPAELPNQHHAIASRRATAQVFGELTGNLFSNQGENLL